MNKMRNIFLGSAAAFLAAATGAQAADMMMDVKAPREPVYRCDITGFIELPGTDICFKVGGFARLVVAAVEDQWFGDEFYIVRNIVPDGHRIDDTFQMYGQGRVNFDARTSTEYGTVRAFVELQATDNDTRSGGAAVLRHAFVQFGNWTFGKTWSTFLHLDSSATTTDPYVVIGDNFMRRNQIRYTQSFGSGWSVSVAIEDQRYNFPTATFASGVWSPFALAINDRNESPDVVANIRVQGDWGNAQLSGAIHNNEFRDVGWTDSDIGWAALFGLVINTPTIGEGDFFSFKAIYTDGASQYNQDMIGTNNVVWGDCTPFLVVFTDCILDSVQSWSVLANFTHNWSPTFNTTLGGGYGQVEFPKTAFAPFQPFAGFAVDTDVDLWQVYLDFAWTPVPRTTFQFDITYGNIDFNGSRGGVNLTPFPSPIAEDDGAFSAAFQVTRSF